MGLKTEFLCDKYAAITPSDTDEHNFKALYVGTGGTLVIDSPSGLQVTFENVADGTLLPISGVRVASSTTASDIVGLR